MRKVKALALVLVGTMLFSMTAFAAKSPSASTVSTSTPSVSTVEAVAAAEGMSVGELTNNAIVETAGIDSTTVEPVACGQGAIINGVKTNFTVVLRKATAATVAEAKSAYAGTLVNVIALNNVPKSGSIQVALYDGKIAAGDKITVMQKVNGVWTKLTASVRAEHVDVVLQGNGPVAIFRG